MAEYLCEEDMNTGEYISRDEALRALHQYCTDCAISCDGVMRRACDHGNAMDIISDMPAADVQPVIHAKWVLFDRDCVGRAFYCSNCRKVTTTDDYEDTPLDRDEYFCMRCGADMRSPDATKG